MDGHPLKVPGAIVNGPTGIKYEKSVYSFSIRAEYTRGFKCPHRKKSEELRRFELGG
jgi:hypothetical protein